MDPHEAREKVEKEVFKQFPKLFENRSNNFSMHQLNSKKNIVLELLFTESIPEYPENLILKIFQTEKIEREFSTLNHLISQGIKVPNILGYSPPYLLLTKIRGINLCDYINEFLKDISSLKELNTKNYDSITNSINLLAEWLARFHRSNVVRYAYNSGVKVLNKGDTRLRDFIYDESNSKIYGVDFEDSYEGEHIDDIAWICCSLLDTDPGIFEMDEPIHKIELINLFLKEYYKINNDFKFSFQYFSERLIENLNIVIERRGMEIGQLDKNSILMKFSRDF